MKVIVARDAVADIERLHSFLERENPDAAQRAVSALDDAIQSLATFPDRGRPSNSPGIRELVVPFGGSAYVLRYIHRLQAETVLILRIWHGRENRK